MATVCDLVSCWYTICGQSNLHSLFPSPIQFFWETSNTLMNLTFSAFSRWTTHIFCSPYNSCSTSAYLRLQLSSAHYAYNIVLVVIQLVIHQTLNIFMGTCIMCFVELLEISSLGMVYFWHVITWNGILLTCIILIGRATRWNFLVTLGCNRECTVWNSLPTLCITSFVPSIQQLWWRKSYYDSDDHAGDSGRYSKEEEDWRGK